MRVCVIGEWVVRGYGESVGVRGGIGTSVVKVIGYWRLVNVRLRGSQNSTRKSSIEINMKYIYLSV